MVLMDLMTTILEYGQQKKQLTLPILITDLMIHILVKLRFIIEKILHRVIIFLQNRLLDKN